MSTIHPVLATRKSDRRVRGEIRALASAFETGWRWSTKPATGEPEKLSGGERQRVAIARALANEPAVLLADEPTANLDSTTGYQLMHTLEVLAKEHGKSVVAVTHDHRIEDVADRVLWLEDGQLSDRPPNEASSPSIPSAG